MGQAVYDAMGDVIFSVVNGFLNILQGIMHYLPEVNENVVMVPENIGSYLYWVGNIINTDAFVFMITVIITYEIFMITVRLFLLIWRLLPMT